MYLNKVHGEPHLKKCESATYCCMCGCVGGWGCLGSWLGGCTYIQTSETILSDMDTCL